MTEPTQLLEATSGELTAEAAAKGFIAVFTAEPEQYFEPGVCRHCGVSLGATLEDKVMPLGAFGFLPNVCCQACSDAGKARLAAEEQKARAANYAGLIPAEFVYWNEKMGNNSARAKVFGSFNPDTRRGLILHGSSGSCKTRLLWEIAKHLVDLPNPVSWLFVDAYDAATVGFPAEAAKVDFLFLDDLGNEPTSTKYETALLRLIRKRCDWHKPIFISTQLTGIAFKKRFFEGAAADAILRRLSERTDKIPTDL